MTQTTRRRAPARPRRQPRVAGAEFRVDDDRLLLVVCTASQKVPEPEPEPPPELPPEAPDELPEEEPEPDDLPAPSRDPDEEPVPV